MSENNENFESLQQLLALKRHEVPPPAYFEDFSGQVIARLKAGEARGRTHWSEEFAGDASWFVRFMRFFEAKPAMVGSFAAALCVMLVIGMMYSDNDTSAESIGLGSSSTSVASTAPVITTATASPQLLASVATTPSSSGLTIMTNYSLQPVSAIFGGQGNPFSQPASFSPAGN